MLEKVDTICALATASGEGAIGIVRLSGPHSWEIVADLFSKRIIGADSHTVHFGEFKDEKGTLIDEVLVTLFEFGKSFTGEEAAEISCHASTFIQQKIIEALVAKGARLAEPGEYTQRAFLNGKMDLTQAEAVADLIASKTKTSHDIALNQMRGHFSTDLKDVREKLINFASLVELELDFSEEDVEFADRTELNNLITEVIDFINRLSASFELGNVIKEGAPVVIVGAPNTGKSTLLNALLGEDRAIVSDIQGTTRDVIEEVMNIQGILFRLIDTAGIREGAEEIEAMGIERSKAKIEQAKIVLCLSDAQDPKSIEEVASWVNGLREQHPGKHILHITNKLDLSANQIAVDMSISAKTGENLEALKLLLVNTVKGDFDLANESIITNARHHAALVLTKESLVKAKEGLDTGVTGDFIAMDIRQAMHNLGTITGDISTDDLLGNIFSKFCIGK